MQPEDNHDLFPLCPLQNGEVSEVTAGFLIRIDSISYSLHGTGIKKPPYLRTVQDLQARRFRNFQQIKIRT